MSRISMMLLCALVGSAIGTMRDRPQPPKKPMPPPERHARVIAGLQYEQPLIDDLREFANWLEVTTVYGRIGTVRSNLFCVDAEEFENLAGNRPREENEKFVWVSIDFGNRVSLDINLRKPGVPD